MTEERLQILSLVALVAAETSLMIYFCIRLTYEVAAKRKLARFAKRLLLRNIRLTRKK